MRRPSPAVTKLAGDLGAQHVERGFHAVGLGAAGLGQVGTTAAGAAAAALFSSSFICGASRNRITRIYSPATAFMHLPAQPAPASSVVISAQIQAMQNADAAV